jgi:hypothetical protein
MTDESIMTGDAGDGTHSFLQWLIVESAQDIVDVALASMTAGFLWAIIDALRLLRLLL